MIEKVNHRVICSGAGGLVYEATMYDVFVCSTSTIWQTDHSSGSTKENWSLR